MLRSKSLEMLQGHECHFDAQFPLDIWYGFVHRSSFLREAKAQTVKPNLFVWSVNQLVWFFQDPKNDFVVDWPRATSITYANMLHYQLYYEVEFS